MSKGTLTVSKTLLRLAAEQGAAMAMKEHIEKTFDSQFPGEKLTLQNPTANFVEEFPLIAIKIPEYDVEFIE